MLWDAYKGYFTVKTLEKKSKSMDILNRVCIQLWGKSFFFFLLGLETFPVLARKRKLRHDTFCSRRLRVGIPKYSVPSLALHFTIMLATKREFLSIKVATKRP